MSHKLAFPIRIPFVEELGLELWGFGDGKAELRVDLNDAHLNSWEVAHGGVLMTTHDPLVSTGMATVEMKTSFMRPAEGPLRALGHLLHKTTTLAFTEGHVYDDQDRLCAHATGTFKYMRR